MQILGLVFGALLAQLPVILVLLAGLIFSLVRWQRHSKVSLLTAIAIVGFLIILVLSNFLNIWLLNSHQQGWYAQQIGVVLSTSAVVFSVLSAVCWGLLLVALFGWRDEQ